ncbi:MAG TPA: hypothetical protein VF987_12355, partial [Rhodospirillales bacterium]
TNPQPGAWTRHGGKELKIFDCAKVPGAKGKPGEVIEVAGDSFTVAAKGGGIRIMRVKPADDKKIAAADYIAKSSLKKGAMLGSAKA